MSKPAPLKMYDEKVFIKENRRVNGKYFKLTFSSKSLARGVQPGQFFNVQISPGNLSPFLRRPFSYFRVAGDSIEMLYEILGSGTALWLKRKKGTRFKS